ncbi:MAG: ABC transporter permease [Thermodesulfobacteriota bacterium]
MTAFLLRRLFSGAIVLFVVASLTFGILQLVPGGPFDKEKKLPAEILANIQAKYQLDQPLWKQYLLYIHGLVQGDLGPSYKYIDRNVNDILKETLPVSAQLGTLALLVTLILGLGTGISSTIRPNSIFDRLVIFLSTLGISIPNFVLGAGLIWGFALGLGILPAARWESFNHAILPALTLGIPSAAFLARLTRSSILEAAGEDYVQTARAKGLSENRILTKHILKNSLIPVVTVFGPLAAALITGSFIVEHIFAIPGMGRFFVTAVANRDYPLIMGVTLVYTTFLVIANLVVDILYSLLDPRMRPN